MLRCLDGTLATTEWEGIRDGLGPWDGLWLNRAVPGSTHLISLVYDWKEWRFKLASYKDTLSGAGPVPDSPLSGATCVGVLVTNTSVNVPLNWQVQTGATLYEWQVSEDAAFTSPQSGTTSDTAVTVLDLNTSTAYYWRVRSSEPILGRWSTAQDFTTVVGSEDCAPELGFPENGSTITDTTPLFTWSHVANATNYQIQVATDPGFGEAGIVIDEELGDASAYESGVELVNGTYYWRVSAVCSCGPVSAWSGTRSFRLSAQPGCQPGADL